MPDPSFLWPNGWSAEHYQQCSVSLSRLRDHSSAAMVQTLTDYRRDLNEALRQNEFLDIDLAEAILAGLQTAWDQAETLDAQHREWLLLATAYLVDPNDAVPDFIQLSGLDDDAFIVATTLRAIGFEKSAIGIEEVLG